MEEKILAVVSDMLNIEATLDTKMEETAKWDSLKTLQIIMRLEEEEVFVPIEKIAKIKSVSDIAGFASTEDPLS